MEEHRAHTSRTTRRPAEEESPNGGVPTWLVEQAGQQQHDFGARTPSATSPRPSQEDGTTSRSTTYAGLCGSPDTRRAYYKSSRQQQQHPGYQQPKPQSNPLEFRNKPQHQMVGSMQRMPASEPIYMDINPSIHQRANSAGRRERVQVPTAIYDNASPDARKHSPADDSPSHGSPTSAFRSPASNNPNPMVPRNNKNAIDEKRSYRHTSSQQRAPNYPYVSPYVSPTAKEYRVPGGMFHNQTPSKTRTSSPQNNKPSSRYDERPVSRDSPNQSGETSMIMFGDDYDLGSINTGMSQQELLQKRRDVKKRREGKEGKYGKKKKPKERIINMPPRLLSMGSWDTSPITKLTSKDNSQHTPYKDSKDGKKCNAQWNILRAFTPPDEGSTDASTRESGEEAPQRPRSGGDKTQRQQQLQNANQSQSDSMSLSSFPLLSTNAKEGLTAEPQHQPSEASVHYTQPGNIPQLQLTAPLAQEETNQYIKQEQQHYAHQPPAQQKPRSEHLDIYQRQHGEELLQLENHLKYLEEQHQQLEEEIQGRQQVDQEDDVPSDEYEDDRPRAVRFADRIAQNMEEQYEKKVLSQESPTSVAQYDGEVQENSDYSTSVLSPNALFPAKPRSILRMKKGSPALDSSGRYPNATRGRAHVPVFNDSHGREVSPIRSPARYRGQPAVYQMGASSDDATSIPDNPDDKDIAVLFDSDADVDLELMRREFDDDSGLISDAFIEAVAAIVLQTAIRRFLAICSTKKLRERMNMGGRNRQCTESASTWRGMQSPDSHGKSASPRHEMPSPDSHGKSASPRREIPSPDAHLSKSASPRREMPSPAASNPTNKEQSNHFEPTQDQSDKPSPRQVHFSTPTEEAMGEQRSLVSQEDFFYDLAAIQIQSMFRGWWVRDSINVDHYCTALIQKTFRGFRARMEVDYDMYRVMVVQAIWRRNLVQRRTRYLFALVVKLQALCRGFIARKAWNRTTYSGPPLHGQHQVQPPGDKGRPPHIRSSYERAKVRRAQRPRKAESPVQPPKPSGIEEARIWHVGAIIIQTYWRSYVCRICYLQSISDVIVVQSIARRWLTRRWLGLSQNLKPEGNRQHRSQPMKPPRPQSASPRFSKFDSFESRIHLSSLGADDSARHGSLDDSLPSVPFRMLSEEDQYSPPRPQEQAHRYSPPMPREMPQAREQQQQSQHGHFNDPSRFGGARTVWKTGTNPVAASSPSHGRSTYGNDVRNSPFLKAEGNYSSPGNSRSQWNKQAAMNQNQTHRTSPRTLPSPQPNAAAIEAPRSKGWNADEEIDKEGTRSLLMAWKQKDKANSFTIRPRSGK